MFAMQSMPSGSRHDLRPVGSKDTNMLCAIFGGITSGLLQAALKRSDTYILSKIRA
jgi:hypothetical protein